MPKSDPTQRALDRLGELRHMQPSEETKAELREFLRARSNLVVAKAAKIVGEQRITALLPDLLKAFDSFMADAPRLDKRCAAVTEIVSALYELDYDEPKPYLAGLKHVQLEGSFGPPVDEAAKLRGLCAQGLLRTRYPDALSAVVPLLLDPEAPARVGAVRALASNGGEAGILLLRLKTLTGDREVEVLGECFAGLLSARGEKSIPFVANYIDSADDSLTEVAILALGESRLPAAFEVLKEKWERTAVKSVKKILAAAMAASRLDEAVAFLVSALERASVPVALDVIEALSIYRHNERVVEEVRRVAQQRDDKSVEEKFRREFE